MTELIGSSILILGYGREGQSTHKYLKKNHPDKHISVADQNPKTKPLYPVENLYLGNQYLSHLTQFDTIIRSPGISLHSLPLHITSQTNIFFYQCPGITIGITGTKGKSTTASLITAILSRKYPDVRLVGNIGKPALDYLEKATSKTIFVIELSSYQLEDLHYSPQYAVILGIKPEHLDHHGNLENYIKAKQNIINHQTQNNFIIYNANDPIIQRLTSSAKSHKITFSTEENPKASVFIKNDNENLILKNSLEIRNWKLEIKRSSLPLLGQGNLENTLAAITVATLFQVPPSQIKTAIQQFQPLPHRLQYLGQKNQIHFYDDSLATIPEATINALEALSPNVETLIAGGFDRGLDFKILGQYLADHPIKNLILFPTTGEKIWQALCYSYEALCHSREDGNPAQKVHKKEIATQKFTVTTMQQAIDLSLTHTSPKKICLLSPASPSFGIFKDYADRGDQLKNLLNL